MLIIVKYRDVQFLRQPPLDFKAAGRCDIFQIDAAKSRRDPLDCLNNLFRILGGQTDGECIHAGKFFKQNGLSLHDRQSCLRADIAQSQHCGSICDNRHRVALHRIRVDIVPVIPNLFAGLRHPRRVSQGQLLPGIDFHLGFDGELSSPLLMKS